jgi:hypothetical protein
MGLNFLKKNDTDHEKFVATKWSQFEYKKTTFRALKRVIKVDLLLIFCCYYTDRVIKTQRIRTEGLSFADTSPGTDPTYAA